MPEQRDQSSATGGPGLTQVASSPHLFAGALTTQRMMVDVLIGLVPVMAMAVYMFGGDALWQVGLSVASCLVAEALFTAMRRRPITLSDGSALVTGVILGLSLPWSAPWYVAVVAAVVAIGIGKIVFGGLGQNIFNPAMVGRAFVMAAFPAALSAGAYQSLGSSPIDALSAATPLTAAKQLGQTTALWPLFLGTVNGSLGETSALACVIGGVYLCLRRTASWEIPTGMLLAVLAGSGISTLAGTAGPWTLWHDLFGGALLFGAFFIATDPVSSPLTPKGKFLFGIGVGLVVLLLRRFSGYPEGVMYAVLLMNALTPLINRWTIPTPVGGAAKT